MRVEVWVCSQKGRGEAWEQSKREAPGSSARDQQADDDTEKSGQLCGGDLEDTVCTKGQHCQDETDRLHVLGGMEEKGPSSIMWCYRHKSITWLKTGENIKRKGTFCKSGLCASKCQRHETRGKMRNQCRLRLKESKNVWPLKSVNIWPEIRSRRGKQSQRKKLSRQLKKKQRRYGPWYCVDVNFLEFYNLLQLRKSPIP